MRIEEKVKIKAPLLKVENFLLNLENNYKNFHPVDHVYFKFLKKTSTLINSEFIFVEVIGGRKISMKAKIIKYDKHKLVEWEALPKILGIKGGFKLKEEKGFVEVTQWDEFNTPVWLSFLLKLFGLDVDMQTFRQHLKEEMHYMKKFLEES